MIVVMINLAILAISQNPSTSPVSPVDAYFSNMINIKAKITYTVSSGTITSGAIGLLKSWPKDELVFVERPSSRRRCTWSSDGKTQSLFSFHEHKSNHIVDTNNNHISPLHESNAIEVLWGGGIQAEHKVGSPDLNVFYHGNAGLALRGRAPNCWWGTFRFPDSMLEEFGRKPNSVHETEVYSIPTVVEVYQRDLPDNCWYRIQIYYDPSIMFLPRYVRSVATLPSKQCIVKEMCRVEE